MTVHQARVQLSQLIVAEAELQERRAPDIGDEQTVGGHMAKVQADR